MKHIPSTVQRFLGNYLWIVRDHLLNQKPALVTIAVLSAISAVAQGGVIAFLAFAIQALEAARNATPAGAERTLISPLATLALFGLGLLVVLLAEAWSSYTARAKTRRLGRDFHHRCMARALAASARGSSLTNPNMPESVAAMQRIVVRDSAHLGKASERLVTMIEPILRFLMAAAILFWVDARLTLIIGPLLFVLVPVIYKLAMRVQNTARIFYERAATQMSRDIRTLLLRVNQQNVESDTTLQEAGRRDFSGNADVDQYFDEYDNIQLANDRIQFATSLVSSLFFVAALLGGGYWATVGDMSWGLVLAYLLSLRQLVNSVRNVLSSVTQLSVLYPAVARYRSTCMTETPTPSESEPSGQLPDPLTIRCDSSPLEGVGSIKIVAGKPITLVDEVAVGRISAASMIKPISEASGVPMEAWNKEICFLGANACIADPNYWSPIASRNGSSPSGKTMTNFLSDLGLLDTFKERCDIEDTQTWIDQWPVLDRACKLAILLLPLVDDPRRWIMIDSKLIDGIDAALYRRIFAELANRFLVITTDGSRPTENIASDVVVIQGGAVAGVGSAEWFHDIQPRLVHTRQQSEIDDDSDLTT